MFRALHAEDVMKLHRELAANVRIDQGAIVGYFYAESCGPAIVGANSVIRSGSVVYADVRAGAFLQTGHHVLIRENTRLGDHVVLGTNTVIEGHVKIEDFVKIESNCYIPTHSWIGRRVFLGPGVVLTNDRYPLKRRDEYEPKGPIIEDFVTVGAGSVVLPDVRIGKGSFVAAGAVVTKDVPPMTLVRGNPGKFSELPDYLREENVALSWRGLLNE